MRERCSHVNCNKKLELVCFPCKCELKFCKLHRLPELHNCKFDFKKNGKDILKKNNPLICNKKIIKI